MGMPLKFQWGSGMVTSTIYKGHSCAAGDTTSGGARDGGEVGGLGNDGDSELGGG